MYPSGVVVHVFVVATKGLGSQTWWDEEPEVNACVGHVSQPSGPQSEGTTTEGLQHDCSCDPRGSDICAATTRCEPAPTIQVPYS